MSHFKLNPLATVVTLLGLYTLSALVLNFSSSLFIQVLIIFITALISYYGFLFLSGKHKMLSNSIITTCILFLLLSPGETYIEFLYPLFAVLTAFFIKFFIEYKNLHPINPAVGGLLILILIPIISSMPEPFISWWGAAFNGSWSLLLLSPILLYVLFKFKKYGIFLSFIVSYFMLQYFLGTSMDVMKFYITTGTLYFMAGVMLVDPKTSPIIMREQIVFGIFAGVLFGMLQYHSISYSELLSIGIMNFLFFVFTLVCKR
ncbi:hypothetical protein HON22_02845 [Candidatus Peregrinibacteria bacterium]|jgi:hypothetical protein|nr:hypothetical protein [Candidatus Peregrinibacteria bacterium]